MVKALFDTAIRINSSAPRRASRRGNHWMPAVTWWIWNMRIWRPKFLVTHKYPLLPRCGGGIRRIVVTSCSEKHRFANRARMKNLFCIWKTKLKRLCFIGWRKRANLRILSLRGIGASRCSVGDLENVLAAPTWLTFSFAGAMAVAWAVATHQAALPRAV